MSSEEMRIELEAFVNTGLREGWCGWPLKEESCISRTSVRPLHTQPARFRRRQGRSLIALDEPLRFLQAGRRCCVEN